MPRYNTQSLFFLIVIFYALSIAIAQPIFAQEKEGPYSQNSIFVEVLGQGVFYSINYDRRITPDFSLRVGFTSWSITSILFLVPGELKFTAIPVTANYLAGGESAHHLELGIGLMPIFLTLQGDEEFFGSNVSGSGASVVGTATIGYRLQPPGGGILFRIGFTPLFTFKKFVPWGGISLGAAF